MKRLVFLRGLPGSGKSTFVEKNGLEAFVVCPDSIRMTLSGLVMNDKGEMVIDQSKGKEVWKRVNDEIENKMKSGDFIILDATNLVNGNLKSFKKLSEKYRYRVYMLDFTSEVSFDDLVERDRNRVGYKRVGIEVLERMNENLKKQNESGIPKWIELVNLDEFEKKVLKVESMDLNEYSKVNIIGDIHGCHTVLREYLNGRLKDDEFYIFTGDYFERGIENVEVLNFLLKIYTKKNVVMLEGNHELYMWQYANNETIRCKEFNNVTKFEFEEAEVDKKEIRRLYRKLRTLFVFEYRGKKVLVTHGGLTSFPKYLSLVSNNQLIRGVGNYDTDVDELFNENVSDENIYQVHGHRNKMFKNVVTGRSINLEGNVESGGYLRVVEFDGDEVRGIEVKNDIFNKKYKKKEITKHTTVKEMVEILKENDFVRAVDTKEGMKSFNFTNKAFYDGVWNNQTMKARGLHVDVRNNVIVARSFDKFFSIEEYDTDDLLE